jgi:hypothetical protein
MSCQKRSKPIADFPRGLIEKLESNPNLAPLVCAMQEAIELLQPICGIGNRDVANAVQKFATCFGVDPPPAVRHLVPVGAIGIVEMNLLP